MYWFWDAAISLHSLKIKHNIPSGVRAALFDYTEKQDITFAEQQKFGYEIVHQVINSLIEEICEIILKLQATHGVSLIINFFVKTICLGPSHFPVLEDTIEIGSE